MSVMCASDLHLPSQRLRDRFSSGHIQLCGWITTFVYSDQQECEVLIGAAPFIQVEWC